MRTSGIAVLAIALSSSASAEPRSVTAEEGDDLHRRAITSVTKPRCESKAADPEEIVVCGSHRPSYRVPVVPQAGARLYGESPTGIAAMAAAERCTNVGANGCPGRGAIPIIPVVAAIVKGVTAVLAGDEK